MGKGDLIMREMVVCVMDEDHLPKQEVERENRVALLHIPRKEERRQESKIMLKSLKKMSKGAFLQQAVGLWKPC